MKKITVLVLSGLLTTFCLTASADTKTADQKWLEAVQKMVVKGERKVSTPSQDRVNLLQTWCKEHGYTLKVTKVESTYKVELTRELARK